LFPEEFLRPRSISTSLFVVCPHKGLAFYTGLRAHFWLSQETGTTFEKQSRPTDHNQLPKFRLHLPCWAWEQGGEARSSLPAPVSLKIPRFRMASESPRAELASTSCIRSRPERRRPFCSFLLLVFCLLLLIGTSSDWYFFCSLVFLLFSFVCFYSHLFLYTPLFPPPAMLIRLGGFEDASCTRCNCPLQFETEVGCFSVFLSLIFLN